MRISRFCAIGMISLVHKSDKLTDCHYRSEEAYARAAKGQGNAAGFKVVERGADGILSA